MASENEKNVAREGVVKPVVSWVYRQFKRHGEVLDSDEKIDLIAVRHFVTEPAKLNRSLGFTIGLKGFEMARIDVGIEMPCYVEEIDSANEVVKQWIVGQVEETIDEIRGNGATGSVPIGTTKITDHEKENITADDAEVLF
jgi:hypothetical protein